MKTPVQLATIFYILVILTGCTTPSKSFINKYGQQSHITVCDGPSWFECFKEAGTICKEQGYEITDKSTSKVYGFFSNTDHKEIIFVCKNSVAEKSISKNQMTPIEERNPADKQPLDEVAKQINTKENSAPEPELEKK